MLDYEGSLQGYQQILHTHGIDFDLTNLAGATKSESEGVVRGLLQQRAQQARAAEEQAERDRLDMAGMARSILFAGVG
jgi:hypothetical protein